MLTCLANFDDIAIYFTAFGVLRLVLHSANSLSLKELAYQTLPK
jgi:hypothetical protein